MKLIKRLGMDKSDRNSYGMFECFYCGSITKKRLSNGYNNKSCGCHKRSYGHGESKKPLYKVWALMRGRCSNKLNDSYKYYGGMGVKVCNEWEDYTVFMAWSIENGYGSGLQIDRIDPDGNYEPVNCRWVTPKINSRNKRTTKLTEKKAEEIRKKYKTGEYTYKTLSKEYGISSTYIPDILSYKRWS